MPKITAAAPGWVALILDADAPKGYTSTPVVGWDFENAYPVPISVFGPAQVFMSENGQSVTDIGEGMIYDTIAAWLKAKGAEIPATAALSGDRGPAPETPTLKDLGISGRATAPLARMGIKTIGDLCDYDRADVADVKGVSGDTLAQLDVLLAEHGLEWFTSVVEGANNLAGEEEEPEDIM